METSAAERLDNLRAKYLDLCNNRFNPLYRVELTGPEEDEEGPIAELGEHFQELIEKRFDRGFEHVNVLEHPAPEPPHWS